MRAFTPGSVLARKSVLLVLCSLYLAPACLAKSKDDVIVMKNGDRLTGEIKQLDHGLLSFKSSYMNASVDLDWNEVAMLQTKDPFIATLTSGKRLTGPIERKVSKQTGDEEFILGSDSTELIVRPVQVIALRQAEESIRKQVSGAADFGLNYTSGTNPTTLSFSVDAAYERDKNVVTLSTSSQFSSQSNAPNSFRYTLDTDYSRFFARRWFAIGIFDYLKSDQQDLNWRTTYGIGFGKEIVRTDRSAFKAFGGFDYSREKYYPSAGRNNEVNSMEGLIGAKYNTFRFRSLDISWDGTMYPSITDSPRVRFNTGGNLKIELIKDLFWSFRVYENYDTQPPVNSPKSDFGLTTSLGFKF
jgi:hypothetical protein